MVYKWYKHIGKHRKKKPAVQVKNPKINYPKHQSEFEVQSYLFQEMTSLGFDVRGEVNGSEGSAFDLVVFDEEKNPIRIIEVKRKKFKQSKQNLLSNMERKRLGEQIERYKRYGVPLDVVQGLPCAQHYIINLKNNGFPQDRLVESKPEEILQTA